MDVKSKPPEAGLFSGMYSLALGVWSWATAIPRAMAQFALHLFGVFENTMVTILWEYQGDNIVGFLYNHSYLQKLPLPADSRRPALGVTSRGVQTDEQDIYGLAREARLRRDVLMGKVLDDLVPALLQALHSMPQKGELERMASAQSQWVEAIREQQTKLLDAQASRKEREEEEEERSGHVDVAGALGLLLDRVGSMDERLIRVLGEDRGGEVGERLEGLLNDLGAVRAEYEGDRQLVLELIQRVARLDAALSAVDLAAPAPAAATGRQVADAAVGADESESESEGEEDVDASIRSIRSHPTENGSDETKETIAMDEPENAPPKIAKPAADGESKDPPKLPEAKQPIAAPKDQPAAEPRKSTGSIPTRRQSGRPRQHSFKEEMKKHLWFGKRDSSKRK
ncbi:hypothetical protein GQ54DRAFT_295769 [Martensiomyces pterosporus]|nr:hypothetical protein GQ54DRAFT_295769 [Martensiomyces pterosporus]